MNDINNEKTATIINFKTAEKDLQLQIYGNGNRLQLRFTEIRLQPEYAHIGAVSRILLLITFLIKSIRQEL